MVKTSDVLIGEMKSPNRRMSNYIWCFVPDEAWKVMQSMPKANGDDRWFPLVVRSVGVYYRRMRKEVGDDQYFDGNEEDPDNPNLRFHDLRHECTSWLFEKNGLGSERWDV